MRPATTVFDTVKKFRASAKTRAAAQGKPVAMTQAAAMPTMEPAKVTMLNPVMTSSPGVEAFIKAPSVTIMEIKKMKAIMNFVSLTQSPGT